MRVPRMGPVLVGPKSVSVSTVEPEEKNSRALEES
jgi:hypothetical protein